MQEIRNVMIEASITRKEYTKQYTSAISYLDLQVTQQALNICTLPSYAQQVNILGVNDKLLKDVTLTKLQAPVRMIQQFVAEHVFLELEQSLKNKVYALAKFCAFQDNGMFARCFFIH